MLLYPQNFDLISLFQVSSYWIGVHVFFIFFYTRDILKIPCVSLLQSYLLHVTPLLYRLVPILDISACRRYCEWSTMLHQICCDQFLKHNQFLGRYWYWNEFMISFITWSFLEYEFSCSFCWKMSVKSRDMRTYYHCSFYHNILGWTIFKI